MTLVAAGAAAGTAPDRADGGSADPAPGRRENARVARHSALLSVSAGAVGILSYTCSLSMAHLLSPAGFTQFAAGAMLIGIIGIVAHALVPLPLADIVRTHPRGSSQRRHGMAFAVLVSLIVGGVSALVTGALTAAFAPLSVALAGAAAALVLFTVAPAQGWLQGELRFARYAGVSVAEVAVRLAFSAVAVALGWGSAGALLGFAVGGLVLVGGPLAMLRDVTWVPTVLGQRHRWMETGDIALTQFVVSTLVGADVVLVALVGDGSPATAGYAALATLAKGPVYVAAGTVLVVYPLLRGGGPTTDLLRSALRSFARLALLAAVALATVPPALVGLVLPRQYSGSVALLPWLSAAGLGYAAVTVLTTVLLGLRLRRRSRAALVVATLVMAAGFAAGWGLGKVGGLAVGSAVGALLATVALAAVAAPALPPGTLGSVARGLAVAALLLVVLELARPYPIAWLLLTAATAALVLGRGEPPARGRHALRPRRPRLVPGGSAR